MEIGSYLLCLTGVLAMGASRADEIAAAPTACAYDKDAMLALDEPALLDARTRLAAVEYPADMGSPPVDGFIELPTQPGQPPMRVRWPPNIDVVDGLVACFDKSYSEAYGSQECRP